MTLKHLLRPARIGGHSLKNRVVALPLYTGYAHPDGKVSALLLDHYRRIAGSGAALVVIGNVAVSADGATSRCNLRVHGDEFVRGLSRLAAAIREEGSLACLQLNHGGPFAKNGRPRLPSPVEGAALAHDISSLRAFMETFPVRARFGLTRQFVEMAYYWQWGMNDEDRRQVIDDFAAGADRARQAGFDMVELHGGTGYLLAAYLSSYWNKIPAGYGGTLRERAAFPLEVLAAVKNGLPEDFPVGFRLMVQEWVPDGIEPHEARNLARMLDEAGVGYLSAIAGTYNSMFRPEVLRITARPAHLGRETAMIRQSVNCPVIIGGRVFSPRVAEKALEQGQADLVGLARPLLADHNWLKKAESGEKINVCVNCNHCLKRVVLDAGVTCARWPASEQERVDLETGLLSRRLFSGLVVAATIQDLELIRTGWAVRILEQDDLYVRFLFLQSEKKDPAFDAAIEEFVTWSSDAWEKQKNSVGTLDYITRRTPGTFEDVVLNEADKDDFGLILLAMDHDDPWRKRLAFRHRTGVIGYIGAHPHPERVVVPVDLTNTTLFLLWAVNHAYYQKPVFETTFVHILDGDRDQAMKRWRAILKILGWDENTPLEIIPRGTGLVEDLLRLINDRGYGTVIMGRRDISALRRFILGSVSAGLLDGIGDRHFMLVG